MSPDGRRTPRTPRAPGSPSTPRTPPQPPGSGSGTTRTFEALPPTKGSRAPFAESWWGRAWLAALENSSMDSGRLQRGRTYARGGAVGEVTVAPGSATARVQGSRPAPYRSAMRVRQLTAEQWDRLLDVIAERAASIAALLDGEMPPELADDADAAGVVLLPGPQDLEPRCNCPDWGSPCKHAAALCYQVARLLDRDPFVLLLLRGRGEGELTDELGRRNLARAAAEAAASAGAAAGTAAAPDMTASGTSVAGKGVAGHRAPTGDPAAAAFSSRSGLPPLPDLPPPPDRPGRGPQLTEASAPAPGVDPAGLELLVADAALRAHRLLCAAHDTAAPDTGTRDRATPGPSTPDVAADHGAQDTAAPGPATPDRTGHALSPLPAQLTEWQDTARLAAAHADRADVFARLAAGCSCTPTRLTAAARAWHHGGAAGLEVLDDSWNPPPGLLARAREALRTEWPDGPPPRLRMWRNRWTVEGRDVQLRVGRDGLWYPYAKTHGTWWPSGPPDSNPAVALAALVEG